MKPKTLQSNKNRLGLGRIALGASAVLMSSLTVIQMPLTAGKPPVEPPLNPKFDRLHRRPDGKGPTPQVHYGIEDAWAAKFQDDKESGVRKPVWKQQLGSSSYDESYGVATDSSGNVFMTGYTYGDLAGPNQGGYSDAWVAKYSPDGALVWKQQLGSSDYDESYGVATDSSGNVFISGETDGDLAGPNQGGYSDAWVAKYSPNGALKWKKQLGTSSYDESYGVATDSSGNVFISGYTNGDLAGSNQGRQDAWVAKYSPDGVLKWKKQLGSSDYDVSYGVATDSSGNVFISGYTYGDLAGSNQGDVDAWVAKYSSNGALKWKKQLGSSDYDVSYGVATDSSGNVFISGYTYGDLAGSNQGSYDAWVAKYSSNGALKWKKQLGTSSYDVSFGVATDSSGNVFISGATYGDLAGSNQGDYDAWVARYNTYGTLKWVKQVGTSSPDASYGVATDSSGNVFISGTTNGNFSRD